MKTLKLIDSNPMASKLSVALYGLVFIRRQPWLMQSPNFGHFVLLIFFIVIFLHFKRFTAKAFASKSISNHFFKTKFALFQLDREVQTPVAFAGLWRVSKAKT